MKNKTTNTSSRVRTVLFLLIFMVSLLPINGFAGNIFVLNTISQTISKYNLQSGQVNNTFAATGLYPNKMAFSDEFIWLVNSGDNNIQQINAADGSTERLIDVEEFSNPYDILIYKDHLYVTGLFTNKVYKISIASGDIVDEVEVGIAPQGLIVVNNKLYVANSGFSYPDLFDGEVSIVDLNSFAVVADIPVPLNPQRMAVDAQNRIHLVCIGDYNENTGYVVVIDPANNTIIEKVSFGNFPYNITIPPNNLVYVADAFNNGVYGYNAETLAVIYDAENPFTTSGGALFSYNDYVIVADAKDFQSNSKISFYDFQGETLFSFDAAIGAVDIGALPQATSVAETVLIPQLNIYPNPSAGNFLIDFSGMQNVSFNGNSGSAASGLTVAVFNVKGQLMDSFQASSSPVIWNGTGRSAKPLPAGIYYVRIADAAGKIITTKTITLIR